jgi:hypothetical protein
MERCNLLASLNIINNNNNNNNNNFVSGDENDMMMMMMVVMKYLKQPYWALGTYSEKTVI